MSTSASLTPGEEILKASLYSSIPLDVKFFLFSARLRKSAGKRVGKPRLVRAASTALRGVEVFNSRESKPVLADVGPCNMSLNLWEVLSGGFSEACNVADFDAGFPVDQDPYTDEYDHFSDSDLDDSDFAVSTLFPT